MAIRETSTIIDRLLAEQRMLTAVERFARQYDAADASIPAQSRYYRDLIPLSVPESDEQYAFEVDLDKCSGCKACVTACHSLNGLESTESWRSVGLLHGGETARPYQQTVTTACHHCADPGCLNGCPVLAYEKDPVTGIVRHLDDQCIGCQYCVWKCPYEVPRYSSRLGVVRKCDMCQSRLAEGEAPACVQSCPNEAIRISVRSREDIEQSSLGSARLVPGAPHSRMTQPATRYHNLKSLPVDARPADADALKPEPPHWPLVFMLVLTQMGVGALAAGAVVRWFWPDASAGLMRFLVLPALVSALAGLAASGTHLGQPTRAWKIFLGWRRSWLSREAMVFGMFALLGLGWMSYWAWFGDAGPWWAHAAVTLAGLLGVASSIMIYHDTGRVLWRAGHVVPRFAGTTLSLGSAAAVSALLGLDAAAPTPLWSGVFATAWLAAAAKLGWDIHFLARRWSHRRVEHRQSVRLLRGPLRNAVRLRFAFGLAGLFLLTLLLWPGEADAWKRSVSLAACLSLVIAELSERYLFFKAVALPRMPGGLP